MRSEALVQSGAATEVCKPSHRQHMFPHLHNAPSHASPAMRISLYYRLILYHC